MQTWAIDRAPLHNLPDMAGMGILPRRSYMKATGRRLVRWMVPDGCLEVPREETAGCVFQLRFSGDGTHLASATMDSTVEVWDHAQRRLCHTLDGHSEIVTSLAWVNSAYEPTLFSASLDKTIRLWRNWQGVWVLREHTDWIRCLGISPDDATLLSGCVSSRIFGWDVASGRVKFSLGTDSANLCSVSSLAFMDHNPFVFVSGLRDGAWHLWDARSLGGHICEVHAHTEKLNTVSFGRNDQVLLSGGRDSTLRLWDMRSSGTLGHPTPLQEYRGHVCVGYNVESCFFNGDQHVVTGSEDKQLYIYDTHTTKIVRRLPHLSVVHAVAAAPEYAPLQLASSSVDACRVYLWTPSSPTDEEASEPPEPVVARPMEDSDEALFAPSRQQAVEGLMMKFGDQLLEIFHQHDFTFSRMSNWDELLRSVGTDNQSSDLLQMVSDIAADFARAVDVCRTPVPVPNATDPHESSSTPSPSPRPFLPSSSNEPPPLCDSLTLSQQGNHLTPMAHRPVPICRETTSTSSSEGTTVLASPHQIQAMLLARQRERERMFEDRERQRRRRHRPTLSCDASASSRDTPRHRYTLSDRGPLLSSESEVPEEEEGADEILLRPRHKRHHPYP